MDTSTKKKSVLYVDQAVSFGGSLVVLGHLVDALDKSRFRPVVVVEFGESILINHIKAGVPVYIRRRIFNYLHWMRMSSIIKKIPGRLLGKIVNYMLTGVYALANSLYFFSLAWIVVREKIDLIHVNNGMNNFAPILVAVFLRRKFVVHYHGIETPGRMQQAVINKVKKFIFISVFLKQKMIENHIPQDRAVVIHNPVEARAVSLREIYELRKNYGIQQSDLLFGIVGRLIRWKGHVEFLKAAKAVLESVPEAKVLVIGDISDGDKNYERCIADMVSDGGYKDRIIFTGYIPDVSVFYQLMDVCVHCSIEPEPFGLVITEAMSYGVPVIASDLGAPKEIIIDGENGYIVDPTATEQLAKVIISLLLDDGLRKKIGDNGRRHVESSYQLEAYGRSMEKIYMEVIGE